MKLNKLYPKKLFIVFALVVGIVGYLLIFRHVRELITNENVVNLNFFVQAVVYLFANIFGIYIMSLFIYGFIWIGCFVRKKEGVPKFTKIVDIYYLSMYVVVFDWLFKAVTMLITGAVYENGIGYFASSYSIIIAIVQAGIVISLCHKKLNYLVAPLLFYIMVISVQIGNLLILNK